MDSHASPPSDDEPYEGPLEITETRIRVHSGHRESDVLKAFATITLNEVFVVHDLKVIQKPERLFVSMPACQNKHGRYRDITHPITKSFRDYLEAVVIDAYRNAVGDPAAVLADAQSANGR